MAAKTSEKPKTWKKKIGEVGVDSGQLVVMDPCYVRDQWVHEGKVRAVKFWGRDWEEVGDRLVADPYNREPYADEERGHAVVDVESDDEADNIIADIDDIIRKHKLLVIHSKVTGSSYDKCCELTGGEDKGGQLNYVLGHSGMGVTFSSGFGDGTYDVIATYRDFGKFGVRVSKVEIILADEEGEEMMEELTSRNDACSCGCEHEHEEVPEA